ncbi:DUF305 domain-containing protein [Streptomyces sp. NPDC051211]|uniref:DUF305 domain-containing protein n=1 Tax=Streptomyces sp. NPDC051211 TaxID=3154643 RepID=UPI00344B0718
MTRTYWTALGAVVLALLLAAAATVATASGSSDTGGERPEVSSPDAGFARDMSVHHQQAVEMSFIVRDRTKDEGIRNLAYDIANTQANQRGMMLGWLDMWGLPKVVPGEEPMAWMAPGSGSASAPAPAPAPASGGGGGSGHGGHGGHGGHSMGGVTAKPGALMPGMATKAELAELGTLEGKQAEILYLQLMTDHHKGGVAMAEGCAKLCETPVERQLAQGMVDAQQSELLLMANLLKQRGAKPRE